MYKIILAVELECSINRTPSPPQRWALSGHWLKGGNVGFKKLLLVLESAELANEEQENDCVVDCVVGLFVEERIPTWSSFSRRDPSTITDRHMGDYLQYM